MSICIHICIYAVYIIFTVLGSLSCKVATCTVYMYICTMYMHVQEKMTTYVCMYYVHVPCMCEKKMKTYVRMLKKCACMCHVYVHVDVEYETGASSTC